MIRDIDRRVIIRERNYWEVYLVDAPLPPEKIWHHKDHQNAMDAMGWFKQAIASFTRGCDRGGSLRDKLPEFIKVTPTKTQFVVNMINEGDKKPKQMMYYAGKESAIAKAKWYRQAVRQHVMANQGMQL